MREIKFRGLYRLNGLDCWAYGFPFIDKIAQISNGKNVYNVIPSTIGQFTGLKDKNGQEIFERDICKIFRPKDANSTDAGQMICISEVIFKNGSFAYYRKDVIGRNISFFLGYIESENIEIIGNIHQNQELLNENR